MSSVLDLSRRLLALSQTGLHFSAEEYDRERYREIGDIAAKLLELQGASAGAVTGAWFVDTGYSTPKVEVRGAIFRDDRVLLVRHSYGPRSWMLPGGGIGRSEDPAAGAAREVREELGCELADLMRIDASEELVAGSRDLQHVFTARVVGEPVADMREIVAVTFADPADLPEPCGRHSRRRIAQAVAHRKAVGAASQQR